MSLLLLLFRLNQLTRAFVFRLSPHSFHTHFTRVHLLCIKSSSLKNSRRLFIKVLRQILWPLTAHATKDRRACKHFHRLSALRARFQKSSPDELFPHKTCFELWHWTSHHSNLFTDPTKVWSTFEPVMIFASKVCWFCPDVARWARPSFTKKPAHTHTHKNPSCPHTGF